VCEGEEKRVRRERAGKVEVQVQVQVQVERKVRFGEVGGREQSKAEQERECDGQDLAWPGGMVGGETALQWKPSS